MDTYRHGPSSTEIGRTGRALLVTILGVCGILGVARDARADAPAPHPSAANFEIKFMTNMIDHHQMAVGTGEMCMDNAVHADLVAFCDSIVQIQSDEIDTMQDWLEDWYGVEHDPEMKPRDERMMEELAALEGAEFEIEFLQMMIEHHERAVKSGQKCQDKAFHPELNALCEDIVNAQEDEIALMEGWLCDWYGICD